MQSASRRVGWLLGLLAAAAVGIACSDMGANSLSAAEGSPGGGAAKSDGGFGSGAAPAGPIGTLGTGVVLVHAAAFPSMRLCFSNLPDQLPQPDRQVMPQANVVGIEVGSAVRLDPLAAPGDVYVIDERVPGVRSTSGSSAGKTCKELICSAGASCLRENRDYHRAGTLSQPLGTDGVDVLAISGCGNPFFLQDVGANSADCPEGWDATRGNLIAQSIRLPGTERRQRDVLPLQILHLSPAVDKARGTGTLRVSFGLLSGPGPEEVVAQDPPLFKVANGKQVPLTVADAGDGMFATHGFRIALTPAAGAPQIVDLSLADVQSLSAPREVPTTYYQAASNYVLLLLGDPAIRPTLGDGGVDPGYDPRRGMHMLAVPVVDPNADAGADGG